MALVPYAVRTLCGNIYLNRDYVFDTLMEPLFWLVDNFAKAIGPVSDDLHKYVFFFQTIDIMLVCCDASLLWQGLHCMLIAQLWMNFYNYRPCAAL